MVIHKCLYDWIHAFAEMTGIKKFKGSTLIFVFEKLTVVNKYHLDKC